MGDLATVDGVLVAERIEQAAYRLNVSFDFESRGGSAGAAAVGAGGAAGGVLSAACAFNHRSTDAQFCSYLRIYR